jgi:hypothetical protein
MDAGFGPHLSGMRSTEAIALGGKARHAIGFVQSFYLIVHEEAALYIRLSAAVL